MISSRVVFQVGARRLNGPGSPLLHPLCVCPPSPWQLHPPSRLPPGNPASDPLGGHVRFLTRLALHAELHGTPAGRVQGVELSHGIQTLAAGHCQVPRGSRHGDPAAGIVRRPAGTNAWQGVGEEVVGLHADGVLEAHAAPRSFERCRFEFESSETLHRI